MDLATRLATVALLDQCHSSILEKLPCLYSRKLAQSFKAVGFCFKQSLERSPDTLRETLRRFSTRESLAYQQVTQFADLHILVLDFSRTVEGETSPIQKGAQPKQEAGFYFSASLSVPEQKVGKFAASIQTLHRLLAASDSVPMFFEEVMTFDPVFTAALAETYFATRDLSELEENLGIYYALCERRIKLSAAVKMLHTAGFSEDKLAKVSEVALSEGSLSAQEQELREELDLYFEIPNDGRLVNTLKKNNLLQRRTMM